MGPALLALLVAFAASLAGCGPEPDARPLRRARAERIVLVTVDTLRADHVGAYGAALPTPAIDALTRDGVLLLGACTPTPSTGPAHASLFTGLHPWRHGVLDNAVALRAEFETLAARLRAHGMATAAFVASYIVHERFGFANGFDLYSFEPTESYRWRKQERERFWARGESVVQAAMRWITAHRDERFFVWVHLFDPHSPYEPPSDYALSPELPVALDGKRLPPGVGSPTQLAAAIRAYRGEVAYADAQIGRLVERLRILALLDRTAVVVTSDHGEGLGDHGLLEHGENLYDELVRVPLVIRAPGLPAGRRLDGPVQLEDLAPTLMALAGAPVPDGLDGFDLLPWLEGRAEASPRPAVVGRRKPYPGRSDLFFARAWPWKWIGPREGTGRRYRLDRDPRELTAKWAAPAPQPLRPHLAQPAPSSLSRELDEEAVRALEALGYLDPDGPERE